MKAARFWLGACLFYTAAAILATWPVARDLGRALPGGGGDAFTHAWNLWYFHRALWRSDTGFAFTNLLYHPLGTSLHFHVLDQGAAIVAEPLQLAGLPLSTIYSLSWLLTFVLSGVGGAFLGLTATGSRPGALVAGLLFMLCPYRTAHGLGHLELIGTEWMPFAAGLLLLAFPPPGATVRSNMRRGTAAILAGVAYAMSFLASFYFGVFFGIFLILYLSWRALQGPAGRNARLHVLLAAGALPLALPVALPFVRAVAAGQEQYHLATEATYPADLLGFVLPSYLSTILGPVNVALTGGAKVLSGRPVEGTVGLGWVALALAILGFRRVEALWKVAAAMFLVLALGTSLHVMGHDLGLPLPYVLLSHVPVLRGARAPSRFVIMASLCMVPLAAAGASRLVSREKGARALPGALLAVGLVELAVLPYPMTLAALPSWVDEMARDTTPGSVLPLPNFSLQRQMYFQTFHHRPLVGGWIARVDPDLVERLFGMVRVAISAGQTADQTRSGLAALGARYVVIDDDAMAPLCHARPWDTLRSRLDAALGPALSHDGGFTVYRVAPAPAPGS